MMSVKGLLMETSATDLDREQKANRIRRKAEEISKNSESVLWQLGQLALALRCAAARRSLTLVIKSYWRYYYKNNHAKYPRETNVELPIDSQIPFEPKALGAYISYVGLCAAAVNFLRVEFGSDVSADIKNFFISMVSFYPEAAEVFKTAQTGFERTGQGGFGIKLLRMIDTEKNASPSLHVIVAAYIYFGLEKIFDARGGLQKVYEPLKKVYFDKTVKIVESVLLVKQHVVMDVALGLVLLSGGDSSAVPAKIHEFVEAIFKNNNYGINQEVIFAARGEIIFIYDKVMADIARNNSSAANEIIKYLRSLEVSPQGVMV
jgi:hypothetical protein